MSAAQPLEAAVEALTSYERLHLDSFEEIRRSQHFEVSSLGRLEERLRLPIGDDLGEYRPEWKSVPLLEELVSHQLRFPQFYIHWHTTGQLPRVYGEIDVFPLLDVAEEGEHPDPAYYQRRTELQRRFLSELRCMAGSRGSGNGHLTYLRVQPDARPIEIWFEDQRDIDSEPYPEGFVRLDLTYREYLDALLITKGARGWEYLFADVALGKPGFHYIVANLRNML